MRIVSFKFFSIFIGVILIVSIISISINTLTVQASVYNMYASTCLGGWKNTNLATGIPEVSQDGDSVEFTEGNSAKLDGGVHAQIYCGGFDKGFDENTVPKKILVRTSWAVQYPGMDIEDVIEDQESVKDEEIIEEQDSNEIESGGGGGNQQDSSDQEEIVEPVTEQIEESLVTPESSEDIEVVEPESQSEQESEAQEPESAPASEAPSASIFNLFTRVAHAQEASDTESDDSEGSLSETTITDISDTTTATVEESSHGISEILYTLDGVEWKSLGFVERDEFRSKYFEIPIEEASEWENISKIQIGIQSVSAVDGIAPTIYLDAVWLEVEYQERGVDPYIPPGEKEGDIILSEVPYGNMKAVLVSRESESLIGSTTLELWLSYQDIIEIIPEDITPEINIDAVDESTVDSLSDSDLDIPLPSDEDIGIPIEDPLLDSEIGIVLPSNEDIDISTLDTLPLDSEDTSVITETLLPEQSPPKQWRFIADDDQLSIDSRVIFLNGNIFWFGKQGSNVWSFNPQSNAYDSTSFNPSESLEFPFRGEAGESLILKADVTGTLYSIEAPIKRERDE